MKRRSDLAESRDKPAVVRAKAEERADFLDGVDGRGVHGGDGGYLLRIHAQSVASNDVTQVRSGSSKQLTLGRFHGQPGPLKTFEHGFESLHVLLEGSLFSVGIRRALTGGPDAHVIQVGHATLPRQSLKGSIHQSTHVRRA